MSVRGDQATYSQLTSERVKTLEDLIRVCQIDVTMWKIESWICNKWDMAAMPRAVGDSKNGFKQESTDPVVTELYQIKVTLKRNVDGLAIKDEIRRLIADAKKAMTPRPFPKRSSVQNAIHLLHIELPDLHLGKLTWAAETGDENYDSKIAESLFAEALETLVARTSSFGFKQVIFIVGNDLLHSDTKQGTTTRGTPLDTDSRFQKSFVIARKMITKAIDRLRTIAPVKAIVIPGNHDSLSTWCLGHSLECYFHEAADVEIDNDPRMRKYHQFEKVMLMFTHGDKGKRSDYPLLMATEQPQMFGTTVHREAHTGHLHQLRVQEHHGVRVRISPALCPPDAWHAENAFVGNARAAEAFVWHPEDGLVSLATYTVRPDASR